MGNDRTRCRGCGKPIKFIKTSNGKTMAVNEKLLKFVPDVTGKHLYIMTDGTVLRGVPAREEDPDVHVGFISHFATCTNPDDFRNRKLRKKDRKEARP